MHVLHICNDFLGTSAHISLFSELDRMGVIQTIYVPIKSDVIPSNRNIDFQTEGSRIVFSCRLKKYHKVFYGLKISELVKDIEKRINLKDVDLIHSAILCNEGAIAYELHKKYNIPYISAVRNTDLNGYMKVFKWRRPYFRRIADNAEKIIFISAIYDNRFTKAINADKELSSKYLVINNGLNNHFLDNKYDSEKGLEGSVKIVITGAFVKNKNIHGLVEAIKILIEGGINIELSAIGNNLSSYSNEKEYSDSIMELEKKYKWFTTYPAQPKEKLLLSLRNNDVFALISFHETFGLSYLEALSQGLPIVYTFGEGFDGTYPDGKVGYGAYPNNPESIAEAIKNVIKNYPTLQQNVRKTDLEKFRWSNIALTYYNLYTSIIENEH